MATVDIIALLDPQAVVFGGGVAAAQGEWFLGPIREMVHRCTPLKTTISALGAGRGRADPWGGPAGAGRIGARGVGMTRFARLLVDDCRAAWHASLSAACSFSTSEEKPSGAKPFGDGETIGKIERLPGGTAVASEVITLLGVSCTDGQIIVITNLQRIVGKMDCAQQIPAVDAGALLRAVRDRRVREFGRLRIDSVSAGTLDLPVTDATITSTSMPRPEPDAYFMGIALAVRARANCTGRRVGAIIVRERRILSTGYNGTPSAMLNCDEGGCQRCANPQSYASGEGYDLCICVHAEQNALLAAARFGVAD